MIYNIPLTLDENISISINNDAGSDLTPVTTVTYDINIPENYNFGTYKGFAVLRELSDKLTDVLKLASNNDPHNFNTLMKWIKEDNFKKVDTLCEDNGQIQYRLNDASTKTHFISVGNRANDEPTINITAGYLMCNFDHFGLGSVFALNNAVKDMIQSISLDHDKLTKASSIIYNRTRMKETALDMFQ